MKKRILSILAVLAVSVNMVGCAPSDSSAPVEATGQVAVETTAETTETFEMKTIEPPEDGWTLDELLSVTYVYGQQLENPCTLSNLGNDYSFDPSFFSSNTGSTGLILQYKDVAIASVGIANDIQYEDVSENTIIFDLLFNRFNDNETNYVIVNGITFYSTREQIVQKLGTPDVSKDYYIAYFKTGTKTPLLEFAVNKNDEITSFHIIY